jgi:murein DD-endopeptidase MepM/ murein hydrolase activator NlpD
VDITSFIDRRGVGGIDTRTDGEPVSPERADEIAQEFEALVIHQMLRQLRGESAGNDEDGDLFGGRMMETIDVELARQLAKGGGLGLADVLRPTIRTTESDAESMTAGRSSDGVSLARAAVPMSLELRDRLSSASIARTLASMTAAPASAHLPVDAMLEAGAVTSPFGWRQDPLVGTARFHAGVDLRATYGTEVASMRGGTVTHAGPQGDYGLTVVIEHEPGVESRSAHLSSILTTLGEKVVAGQVIGRVGSSGRATGPHLHFEVSRHGRSVDPLMELTDLAAALKKSDRGVDSQGEQWLTSQPGAGVENNED